MADKAQDGAARRLRAEQKSEPTVAAWFVHLLRCADGSLYTGITNDLDRRCERHNAGAGARYTRGRLPVTLVYREPQASQSLALKCELAIKALSRRRKELLVQSQG